MFNNLGQKIRVCAQICKWLGIVVSLIIGGRIYLYGIFPLVDVGWIGTGIVVALLGVLLSWVVYFGMIGFSAWIEDSDKMVQEIHSREETSNIPN